MTQSLVERSICRGIHCDQSLVSNQHQCDSVVLQHVYSLHQGEPLANFGCWARGRIYPRRQVRVIFSLKDLSSQLLVRLFNRELAADSAEHMEEWVSAINQAILAPSNRGAFYLVDVCL